HYGFSFEFDHGFFDRPSVFLLGRQDSVVGFQDALSVIDKFPRGTFAVMDTACHKFANRTTGAVQHFHQRMAGQGCRRQTLRASE
ncbi:hypothetical protein ABWK31_20600, partial [Bacillus sp. JJ353]